MSRQRVVQRLFVALVLALGLGVAWGVIIVMGSSVFSAFWPSPPRTMEYVGVAVDGTPLIVTQIANDYLNTTRRTLEGQAIELESEISLQAARFFKPYREPRFVLWPITWNERIAGCSDYSKPPAVWILVRDDRRPGHAYFVGYDTISKAKIGHIGGVVFVPACLRPTSGSIWAITRSAVERSLPRVTSGLGATV